MTPSPPFLAIALLSAAALGYEVLLLRLFAIIQWHHFAYMIISLALLGYGASGTFLTLIGAQNRQRFSTLFAFNAVLFGFTAIICFFIAQQLPFNPLNLLWSWHQPLYLSIIYLLLAIPFFFAANSIGLSFYHFREHVGRIYGADLLGAGLGALGVVVLLFIVSPLNGLKLIGILGLISATLALWQGNPTASPLWKQQAKGKGGWLAIMLSVAAGFGLLIVIISKYWDDLKISPYKGLSQTLQISGTRILTERSSPLGWLSVVENQKIPFRYAPGLSLNNTTEPPQQLGIFTDGDALTVINQYAGQRKTLDYLDFLTSALPYHLLKHPKVLSLGAGGGTDILQALYHNASHIEAVELNSQMVDLVKQDYADFAGQLYDNPQVQIHLAEARAFIAGTQTHYDLIQVALLDSFGASSAGLYALTENYLYTIEALQQLLAHLNSGGLLAITRWLKLPPRDSLKLFAMAVTALENSGVKQPGKHLILIRGWKTSTLLIKKEGFTSSDLTKLRHFCNKRSFDVVYYPGISPSEVNRYNLLDHPYFYQGTTALLSSTRDDFMARYKYDLTPATDDRPYFFNFFKWQLLPELFSKRGRGGMGLLEWGYLVLIATLLQAVFFSLIFIILPLLFKKSQLNQIGTKIKTRVLIYFLALGLAFLLVEIAFIQKFILFLGHPLYAIAIVLCAFLIFGGLGSYYSNHLRQYVIKNKHIRLFNPSFYAILSITTLALSYLLILSPLLQWLTPQPAGIKVLISLLLIAPLAIGMGMPFPLGLSSLSEKAPNLIPWAWGINGCASVLSAVLATVLAIHFGFAVVILIAISLYLIAAWAYP